MKTKKILRLLVTVIVCSILLLPNSVFADGLDTKSKIQQIAKKYGLSVSFDGKKQASNTMNAENQTTQLTLAEFESLAQYISKMPVQNSQGRITIPAPKKQGNLRSTSTQSSRALSQGSYTWKRWAPLSYTSPLGTIYQLDIWRNCTCSYNYGFYNGKAYFDSERSIASWLSGLGSIGLGWTQTGTTWNSYTTNFYKDTMKVTVTGYGYVGFSVEGLDLSIHLPTQTWTFSLIFKY